MAGVWATAARQLRLASAPLRRRKAKRLTAEARKKLQVRLNLRQDTPLTPEEAKRHDVFLRCLDPPKPDSPQLTPEQLAQGEALAKAYQKGMNARAHRHRVDLNHKQEMKACAIAALPTEELQVDAMLVDDPTVPLMLRLPTVTPPHAGWHRPDNVLFLSPEEEEAIATREAKTATGVVTGSAAGEGWDEDR